MLCHQCGSAVSPDATQCPNCQATLKRTTRTIELPSGGLQRYTQKLKALTPADRRMFKEGEVIGGRYELGEMLGRGEFGQVFMAMDTEIDVSVAIKVFAPDFFEKDPSLKRFEPALKHARKLDQVNIVRINEHGQHDKHLWVAMQHLEGLSLRKLIKLRESKSEHFDADEISRISRQILDALTHINKHHPHTNLKPENVIFLPDMLKVTDHYLYRALHPDALRASHIPNAYLAPEIKKISIEPATQLADVFSLGAIIAELAFGVNTLDALRALPSQKGFHAPLRQECERALAIQPSSRHPSLIAFAEALDEALQHTSETAASVAPAHVPASAPPPAPFGNAPSEVEDDEPVNMSEALGLAESSASLDGKVEALSDDEMATLEAERVLSRPELGDLLPTNEVERGQIPVKRPPALAASPSTSSLIDARNVSSKGTAQASEQKGFPLGIIVFIAVAVIIIAALITINHNKKGVVRIDDPSTSAVTEDEAARTALTTPPVEDLSHVALAPDAAPDLGVAEPQVLAALGQAMDMGVKALDEASAQAAASANEPPATGDPTGLDRGASPAEGTPDVTKKGSGGTIAATSSLGTAKATTKDTPVKDDEEAEKTDCPKGMVLLKSKSAPSTCLDRYEYPGSGKPMTRVTWFEAKKLCEGSGKRLCARSEWARACGGKYPWKGSDWDANKCNTTDEDDFERSLGSVGAFKSCRSSSGAYDMVGNAFEWTNEKRIVGGSHNSGEGLASCGYSSAKSPSSSAADIGFRCCAEPQ